METNTKQVDRLIAVNLVLVLIGVILSYISSARAYSLSQINLILAAGGIVVLLDLAVLVFKGRLVGTVLTDGIHFITTLLTTAALSMMISGRVLLMGYVYFSDLEKGNPMAVSAMNIAVISWVIYLIALVINIWVGFIKKA